MERHRCTLALGFSLLLACLGNTCVPQSDCEQLGYYNDGVCDEFCDDPDPDCIPEEDEDEEVDHCEVFGYYGDGICHTTCDEYDYDCDIDPEPPPERDPCEEFGYYGDGFCDTDCWSYDFDCDPEPEPTVAGGLSYDGSTAILTGADSSSAVMVRSQSVAVANSTGLRIFFDNRALLHIYQPDAGHTWYAFYDPTIDPVWIVAAFVTKPLPPSTEMHVEIYRIPTSTFSTHDPAIWGAVQSLQEGSEILQKQAGHSPHQRALGVERAVYNCDFFGDMQNGGRCISQYYRDMAYDHIDNITHGLLDKLDRFGSALAAVPRQAARLAALWSQNLTELWRDGSVDPTDFLDRSLDITGAVDTVINMSLRGFVENPYDTPLRSKIKDFAVDNLLATVDSSGVYQPGNMDEIFCGPGQQLSGTACVTANTCSGGQFWNGSQCICPASTTWNGSTCTSNSECPSNQVFNGSFCACPTGTNWDGSNCIAGCSPGTQWDGTQCIPGTTCTGGLVWDGAQCVCPAGQSWNGSQCVASTATLTIENLGTLRQQGSVSFFAESVSGYSQTRLQVDNLTSRTLAIDITTANFVPNIGSGQRVGLSRAISVHSRDGHESYFPWPDKPWVMRLEAGATSDLNYSSRCLDQSRASPSGTYSLFFDPLPTFISESLRRGDDQSTIWSIIGSNGSNWGSDPRSTGNSYKFTINNKTGGHLKFTIKAFGMEPTWSLAPDGNQTIEMAFKPSSFEYHAEPDSAGEALTWDGIYTPGGSNQNSLDLTLSGDFYVLKLKNQSGSNISRLVTNKGLQSERTYNITLPSDGSVYNYGFHRRFSNSNVFLYTAQNSYWEFSTIAFQYSSAYGYYWAQLTMNP